MRRLLGGLLAACSVLWLSGAVRYDRTISSYTQTLERGVEAIVVLTGGARRLETGARLLLHDVDAHLFITGVGAGLTKHKLMETLGLDVPKMGARVTLGYQARDTAGNAQEAKAWIMRDQLHRIALVTAHYHMPRALMEFQQAMPGVDIVPVGVHADLFRQPHRGCAKAKVLFGEYNKFLYIQFKSCLRRWGKNALDTVARF